MTIVTASSVDPGTERAREPAAGVPPRRVGWKARVGIALSAIPVLFLLFDSIGKLLKVAPVVVGTAQLGYPEGIIRPLGIVLLLCVAVYLIPRLSILGRCC